MNGDYNEYLITIGIKDDKERARVIEYMRELISIALGNFNNNEENEFDYDRLFKDTRWEEMCNVD